MKIAESRKDARILPIFKKGGAQQDVKNYWEISLLNEGYTLFPKIIFVTA
jgi:hypothetical protein